MLRFEFIIEVKRKKMKKKVLLLILMLAGVFAFAENEESDKEEFLYVVTTDELGYFFQSYNWLQRWEAGEVKVSDKDFPACMKIKLVRKPLHQCFLKTFSEIQIIKTFKSR